MGVWAALAVAALALSQPGRPYEGPDAAEAADSVTTPAPTPTDAPSEPDSPGTAAHDDEAEPADASSDASTDASSDVREVVVPQMEPERSDASRAGSIVQREQLEERLARSAPDALRYEPGVYVQQTAHGQASPYVRGLTGQQTVMFFDGVRLNNSTFRQGPNQYFFTVDSRTIDTVEVVRGAASTRYGADALGGALLTTPTHPRLGEAGSRPEVHAMAVTHTGTADASYGGRGQLELGVGGKFGVLGGVGYRSVGQLRSGGPVISPETGEPQRVPPLFGPDGKTQRGTGFRELTGDTRVVWSPADGHALSLGYYDYRQYDAPRTDKCPPPTAPQDECLEYEEQFRTLVYAAYDGETDLAAAKEARATLSFQRQHERRRFDRGSPSQTTLLGLDDVNTVGVGVGLRTANFDPAHWLRLHARYGADAYTDFLQSEAQLRFEDTQITTDLSRGQYIEGSRYTTAGAFVEGVADLVEVVHLRTGGRVALADADTAGDVDSETAAVNQTWATAVGMAGISVDAVPWLRMTFNADQGFRAPNLDDLTSRQQTGPGFQFENPSLKPERALTLEGGLAIDLVVFRFDAWVYRTAISDLIGRVQVDAEMCPEQTPSCGASQTRFRLENFDGRAVLLGTEASARAYLPYGLWARATLAYARGERPNPFGGDGSEPSRLPMSRVPPLNGIGELGWHGDVGVYVSGAVRWARLQSRLAPQDVADARIPLGGTPGYVVADLRAGYRLDPYLRFSAVFENIADTAWRAHGSSVNGPGRSLMLETAFGF